MCEVEMSTFSPAVLCLTKFRDYFREKSIFTSSERSSSIRLVELTVKQNEVALIIVYVSSFTTIIQMR